MTDPDPFFFGRQGRHLTYDTDVASRLSRVPGFDRDQCRAALEIAGLQKTVRIAVERRLRALAKADAQTRPAA